MKIKYKSLKFFLREGVKYEVFYSGSGIYIGYVTLESLTKRWVYIYESLGNTHIYHDEQNCRDIADFLRQLNKEKK